MNKHHLRTPGPSEVPEKVLRSMLKPMINHRGDEFVELFKHVSEEIKYVYQTKNDVLIFPSAGTGVMEAAVVNFFSPGDLILAFPNGVFSERFAVIAESFGAKVERIPVEWGKAVSPEIIKERISKDVNHEVKGILFTQNETSTGVLNDIKSMRAAVGNHPALVLVDAVSSLGAADLKTDEWNLDVVITGSQKALMLPPGLGFVSVSPKAWEYAAESKMPKFYWDFKAARKRLENWQTPYTPAVSLIYALKKALEMIKKEGLSNVFSRHLLLSKGLRAGLKNIGLKLYVEDSCASPTVTAVDVSEYEGKINFSKVLKNNFNITIAGGQGALKNKIIRIGHLGYIDKLDIISTLAAIEMSLGDKELFGRGVKAAEAIFIEEEKE